MSSQYVFTPLKRGIVSVRTGKKPQAHITLLWRHSLDAKTDFPDKSGVYVLADMVPGKDGAQSLYVGRSADSLLNQHIHQHCITPYTNISRWSMAVCITGDDRNSTLGQVEARALEHLLHADLNNLSGVSLANMQTPSEPSLPNSKWETLKAHQRTVVSLLGTLGVLLDKPATLRQTTERPLPQQKKRSSAYYPEKVPDLIAAGMLQVGDVLHSTTKVDHQQAEAVINDNQGNIKILRYAKDSSGRWLNDVSARNITFGAPSAAGGFVIREGGGASEPNGWEFWATASNRTLAEVRDEYRRRK